jgi:hypothetical protein
MKDGVHLSGIARGEARSNKGKNQFSKEVFEGKRDRASKEIESPKMNSE